MAAVDGWNVLLRGERVASGRMDLEDGRRLRARVKVERGARGVSVTALDVVLDDQPGPGDLGDATLDGGGLAPGDQALVA